MGVLEIESFYPARERFELAMTLNNLLASPSFGAWLEGEPLDVDKMLFDPAGRGSPSARSRTWGSGSGCSSSRCS